MRTIILFLFLCGSAFAQKKTTVALLDLTVGEGLPANIAPVLSNLIRQEFVRSESYDILDRGNMESILREQNFSLSDQCNSKECAVQVGQLLGVEKMLFGDMGMLGKKTIINLQLVDVTTGKIDKIENESHVGAIEDIDAVVIRLARKMTGVTVKETAGASYQVYVTSEPEGAAIYVGDELRGTTPVTLIFIKDTPVKIYVKAENYQDWFQEIKPRKEEKLIINAKLLQGKSGKSGGSTGMSQDELKVRYELFDMKKKSSGIAGTLSFLCGWTGAGHFYAKSTGRALIICGTGIFGYYSLIKASIEKESPALGVICLLSAWVADGIGAQYAVKSHNEKIKKELKIALEPTTDLKGGQVRFSVRL